VLGPHAILSTPAALAWAARAGIVKSLDNGDILRAATLAKIRVFRHYFATQDFNRSGASVVSDVLAALGSAPATHVELFNEGSATLGAGLERHVALTAEAVAALRVSRPDLTLIGFCFGTGNCTASDWAYLRAHQFGGVSVVGLHAYWGNAGYTPFEALRYRTLWNDGDPLLAITECGRDRVEGGIGGWIADGLSPSRYAAELTAYDTEISKDSYVLGATPFTAGPTPDWANYSTDTVSSLLAGVSPVATVGQGFTKCISFIGGFIQDQLYHFPGTANETSLAVAERGYAVWRKSTNETWCFADDGSSYRDFGNHSTNGGALVKVSGPFP